MGAASSPAALDVMWDVPCLVLRAGDRRACLQMGSAQMAAPARTHTHTRVGPASPVGALWQVQAPGAGILACESARAAQCFTCRPPLESSPGQAPSSSADGCSGAAGCSCALVTAGRCWVQLLAPPHRPRNPCRRPHKTPPQTPGAPPTCTQHDHRPGSGRGRRHLLESAPAGAAGGPHDGFINEQGAHD
jgi:hypothetical protein